MNLLIFSSYILEIKRLADYMVEKSSERNIYIFCSFIQVYTMHYQAFIHCVSKIEIFATNLQNKIKYVKKIYSKAMKLSFRREKFKQNEKDTFL